MDSLKWKFINVYVFMQLQNWIPFMLEEDKTRYRISFSLHDVNSIKLVSYIKYGKDDYG